MIRHSSAAARGAILAATACVFFATAARADCGPAMAVQQAKNLAIIAQVARQQIQVLSQPNSEAQIHAAANPGAPPPSLADWQARLADIENRQKHPEGECR